MLTGVMTNAIRHVHWKNGLWNSDGGIERHAVVLGALAALADDGPGHLSLDESLGIRLRGAVYLAERGEELLAKLDADEALTRSTGRVGAAS